MTARTVADAMTPNPITVKPELPLKQAIQVLAENKISSLPVVDDTEKLVGILSETDILWQESGVSTPPYITILDSVIYLENPARYEKELHKALGQTVAEVMTQESVTTITADQSLSAAARLLHEKRIHQLPVVDQDQNVIGMISCSDIIRMMATDA